MNHLTVAAPNSLTWFPYRPRPNQDKAIEHAVTVFNEGTVGLLAADCGVGKTAAALAGYLASQEANLSNPTSKAKLIVLTRTHSQSKVFECELEELRRLASQRQVNIELTATSMVSRIHICPLRDEIKATSSKGFMHGCAALVNKGECSYYWSFYIRDKEGKDKPRDTSEKLVKQILADGVVTIEIAENKTANQGLCPYELLRHCARRSRVIIGPYGYLFRESVRSALLASLGTDLSEIDILVDEAHNLADHVLEAEAVEITGEDLRWLMKHKGEIIRDAGVDWLSEVVEFLWGTMEHNLDTIREERVVNIWDVFPRFVLEKELILLLQHTKNLVNGDTVPTETPLDRLVAFLYAGHRATQSEDWLATIELQRKWADIVDRSPDNVLLKIRPLNAAGLTAPVLRGARSAFLMSGTLRPLQHYASLLGVRTALQKDVSSPYPIGTRLVLLDRVVTTKYSKRTHQLWRIIAHRINTSLVSMPANKSALIAFPSYRIMQEVLSHNIDDAFRSRIVESREARIDELKEALQEGPHAVYCVYGGKFSEGVDLVHNGSSMIDLIVGVGIPFSPPTTYQKALQTWYEEKYGEGAGYYYSEVLPSIQKVAQLVGRLRRAPDDWGIVVLMDSRFAKHLNIFGNDIVNEIWPYSQTDDIRAAIQAYLAAREMIGHGT